MNLFAIITLLAATISSFKSKSAISDQEKVEACIRRFVEGGDHQDQEMVASVIHENFRVVLNSGDGAMQLIDKPQYLSLMKQGKIGGTPRTLHIENIDVYGEKTAAVKVRLKSAKMTFYNYYSLVRVHEEWKLIQDLVHVIPE